VDSAVSVPSETDEFEVIENRVVDDLATNRAVRLRDLIGVPFELAADDVAVAG
jgi:hypothetical protein